MTEEEWAREPTVAALTWEIWSNWLLVSAELTPGSDKREPFNPPPGPYTLRAQPQRRGLPVIDVPIEAGMTALWCHKSRISMGVGGQHAPRRFEYVAFGRRHPDGHEDVWTVFPDGAVQQFHSLDEALS